MSETKKPKTAISEKQVLEYLQKHPEFWEKSGAKLIPEKEQGVLDFQQIMFEKMRLNSKQDQMEKQALIDLGRANFVTFRRIQDCILSALASENMGELIDVVCRDWAILLELDVVVIGIETDYNDRLPLRGMSFLEKGYVESILGDNDVIIYPDGTNKAVFGSREKLVASHALIRLPLGDGKPDALIGFGISQKNSFDIDQGTESIVFLCQSLGYIVRRWLVL